MTRRGFFPAALMAALLQLILPAAAAAMHADKTPADGERPRIGLVLGGGGARGAAHIGVLRELERLHIPIDAIAGTSMGAIVGGLYAAGKTPADLEEIVASLDWSASFDDRTPRRDLQFRRKQDDSAYPIQFELGLRDGRLRLPRGLIQGQKLGHILRELTLATAGIESFDELPIPFRAVASDIETGEAYVMSSSDLAQAMRASMSAPGIFAPVVVSGHTLVDGGLVGNVPVHTIQSMGVDVIIAVDVEFPLYSPEQLNSALDITGQVLTILIRKETRRQLEALDEDDILIRPDLGQFGSSDFADIVDAIEPGALATQQAAHLLERYSLDEAAWQQHLAARVRKPASRPYPTLDFVRVVDGAPLSTRVLESRLSTQPGDTMDPDRIADDIARLYGLDLYEFVDYRIVRDGDKTGVEFDAQPKSWGPNYLNFGVQLEDDFDGTTAFNLSARLTRAGVNRLGAEWRTDVQFGTEPLLISEFYQPLRFDARYFIAPRIDLRQNNFRTFSGDDRIARYRRSESQFGIDLGRELGR
ncbi:MAG: patatin-like phospholipase family protein [Halioglobus sp.]|nr:patatin-like phospholipase family protein [Halioglobus sp.]